MTALAHFAIYVVIGVFNWQGLKWTAHVQLSDYSCPITLSDYNFAKLVQNTAVYASITFEKIVMEMKTW